MRGHSTILLLLALPAGAAAGSSGERWGDPERGQAIVVGGGPAGRATSCLECHGVDGRGEGARHYPRLAGQPPFYLYKQLRDYASGWRGSAVMAPVARALDERGMRDAAAYYARIAAPFDQPLPAAPAVLETGRHIAEDGVPGRGIPACADCHGPAGEGVPPAVPALAGQHPGYLTRELERWARGDRRNDPLGAMSWIATALAPAERVAVGAWYGSLPPPGRPGSS